MNLSVAKCRFSTLCCLEAAVYTLDKSWKKWTLKKNWVMTDECWWWWNENHLILLKSWYISTHNVVELSFVMIRGEFQLHLNHTFFVFSREQHPPVFAIMENNPICYFDFVPKMLQAEQQFSTFSLTGSPGGPKYEIFRYSYHTVFSNLFIQNWVYINCSFYYVF